MKKNLKEVIVNESIYNNLFFKIDFTYKLYFHHKKDTNGSYTVAIKEIIENRFMLFVGKEGKCDVRK